MGSPSPPPFPFFFLELFFFFRLSSLTATTLRPIISSSSFAASSSSASLILLLDAFTLRCVGSLLAPAIRKQRKEYERIIHSCDTELCRCEATERDATQRIEGDNEDDEETLMMDVDLVSSGVFQRIDACSLLPMLASRKEELNKRLVSARVELSIMTQSTYELACIHAQRVARRFLVRCRLNAIRRQVYDAARESASVEIQRIVRSKLAFIETERLRTLKDHHMATKLQSLVRMRVAMKERRRLYGIYYEITDSHTR